MKGALLVGGSGAVGSLFADLLVDQYRVRVADPVAPGGLRNDAWIAGSATDSRTLQVAREADVVVLCVPEAVAIDFVEEVGAELASHQLLVDTLSVKTGYLEAARARVTEAGILSLNPMFAPDLGFEGRSVATISLRSNGESDELLQLLESKGAHLVHIEAAEHDRLTAALQVAGHAAVLAFGSTLASLGYDASQAARLWPPPHRTLLALLARMGQLDPEVYRDIQTSNPAAAEAREHLASSLRELSTAAGDPDAFEAFMRRALAPLGARREELAELAASLFASFR